MPSLLQQLCPIIQLYRQDRLHAHLSPMHCVTRAASVLSRALHTHIMHLVDVISRRVLGRPFMHYCSS